MDAVKYLKAANRMCNYYRHSTDCGCSNCPCYSKNNGTNEECLRFRERYPEKDVSIVEKWSEEHPAKTRQSEFLKMFPNAKISIYGALAVCPGDVDSAIICHENGKQCSSCTKEYWLAEVD